MPRFTRNLSERFESSAVIVRLRPVGEADVIVTLFTKDRGLSSVIARSARRSSRRFSALEPLHGVRVTVEISQGKELGKLVDCVIERPRLAILQSLERLESASRLLGWLRIVAPAFVPEPQVFALVDAYLDTCADLSAPMVKGQLERAGLSLLSAFGYRIEVERCVVCGRPRPDARSARIDVARGGLVCRSCGHATEETFTLSGSILDALAKGTVLELPEEDIELLRRVVDAAVVAHAPSARR